MCAFQSELMTFVNEYQFYIFEVVLNPSVIKMNEFLDRSNVDLSDFRTETNKFTYGILERLFLVPEKIDVLFLALKILKIAENFAFHCSDFENIAAYGQNLFDDLKTFSLGVLKIHIDFKHSKDDFVEMFKKEDLNFAFSC